MCGIAGTLATQPLAADRIAATKASLARRGPDADGVFIGRLGQHTVTLVHTRLAIIDLDPRSNQPFVRDDLSLVFNGEIYNYRELRRELEEAGHRFVTASDTEVIVEAYRRWGPQCTSRFEGMWALALLDQSRETLWLSRDRFGEKPLFLWRRGSNLYFASEVKALAAMVGEWPAPDLHQIKRYLVNGYKALHKVDRTWFRDIEEVSPACSLVVRPTETKTASAERYWTLSYRPRPITAAEAVAGVRDHLKRSMELRLRADVPLAFCLSGGIDSGLLAGIATRQFGRRIHAFSIVDSDPRYDERDTLIKTVTFLDCDHHTVTTSRHGFLDRLARQVAYRDAPVVTISYYVHEFLSEAISKAGYKVAISGTGADELFTGYYDHYGFWLAEMAGRPEFPGLLAEWREGYGRVVRNPVLQDPLVFHTRPETRSHIYLDRDLFQSLMREPLEEDFFEKKLSDNPLRNRMLNELAEESVPIMLNEDDRDSMYWSIENRSPFLDRELAEFAFTVPNEHLVEGGRLKRLIRDAGVGLLPDEVRLDKRKRGFNASIDSLLDRADPNVRERLMAPGAIFELVDRDALGRFLDEDMTDNSRSKFLFSFVSARLFLDTVRAAA